MGGPPDRTPVRLAELVAALSLGIDLGFGQPMEHVLRQCLIATRLAERVGLDEPDRAGVYYTALLINVGCHTDAHEQAKWFGDDIDLKANKYDYEPKSFREIVAVVRRFGAGRPPLQRVRTGVEFALHGRHDVEGMIVRHAALARLLAEELGLPGAACDASRRRVRAVGRQGLAGGAGRRGHPDRGTDRVAGRVRRGRAPGPWHRRGVARSLTRGRHAVRPDPRRLPQRRRR